MARVPPLGSSWTRRFQHEVTSSHPNPAAGTSALREDGVDLILFSIQERVTAEMWSVVRHGYDSVSGVR